MRTSETPIKNYLPLITPLTEEAKILEPALTKRGTETILVAEDDIHVRELIRKILEMFGYNVIEARDGADAISVFNKIKIKSIFISGDSADIIHKKGIFEEGLDFLSKPILQKDILNKIREVLDR